MTIGFLSSCDRGPSQTTVELARPEAAKPSDPEKQVDSSPAPAPSEMILIPAGTYTMGDSEEIDAPPHEVKLSSFYMDTYLVTQEQYEKAMAENPSRWKREKNPVEQVRWSDAARYCNKRSELEGLEPCYNLETWECDFKANGYRLPTEAEWEYACRAGCQERFR